MLHSQLLPHLPRGCGRPDGGVSPNPPVSPKQLMSLPHLPPGHPADPQHLLALPSGTLGRQGLGTRPGIKLHPLVAPRNRVGAPPRFPFPAGNQEAAGAGPRAKGISWPQVEPHTQPRALPDPARPRDPASASTSRGPSQKPPTGAPATQRHRDREPSLVTPLEPAGGSPGLNPDLFSSCSRIAQGTVQSPG